MCIEEHAGIRYEASEAFMHACRVFLEEGRDAEDNNTTVTNWESPKYATTPTRASRERPTRLMESQETEASFGEPDIDTTENYAIWTHARSPAPRLLQLRFRT